ncbi:MAG: glycosyl transferase family 1, partial [Roseiflexus castenholzii]
QVIREMVASPERMARTSARNLERARSFAESRLREQRLAFFQRVREQTEAWLADRHAATVWTAGRRTLP